MNLLIHFLIDFLFFKVLFMNLFLERMGALSATKLHVSPRLPKS